MQDIIDALARPRETSRVVTEEWRGSMNGLVWSDWTPFLASYNLQQGAHAAHYPLCQRRTLINGFESGRSPVVSREDFWCVLWQ